MERYIGLDPHGTSCTFGVIGPSGRKLRSDVVETNGGALVSYLRSIPGRKHLCLEEGLRRLPVSSRWATEKLHEQYDLLLELKRAAERELVSESRKHRISRYLGTVPGLGPIRVARPAYSSPPTTKVRYDP